MCEGLSSFLRQYLDEYKQDLDRIPDETEACWRARKQAARDVFRGLMQHGVLKSYSLPEGKFELVTTVEQSAENIGDSSKGGIACLTKKT